MAAEAHRSGPAGRAGLKADKNRNTIAIDEKTAFAEIPPQAWEYKLGKRSALEWVLDQYREKSPATPPSAGGSTRINFPATRKR